MAQQNRKKKESLITGYDIPNDYEFLAVSYVVMLLDFHTPTLRFQPVETELYSCRHLGLLMRQRLSLL